MTTEASPRPWHVDGSEITCADGTTLRVAGTSLRFEPTHVNAALIVRAVNCHDDFVTAARRLIEACGNSEATCPVCGPFRAALAKAREP